MLQRVLLMFLSCVLFISSINGEREKVVLLSSGSYDPPKPFHLALFEMARDHLREMENVDVIAGVITPNHELYKLKNLTANFHRRKMMKLALASSDWIRLSEFKFDQPGHVPIAVALRYHQYRIDSILKNVNESVPNWLPPNFAEFRGQKVQIRRLCGSDNLVHRIEDTLPNYGVVVIARGGFDPRKQIYLDGSDLLFKHRANITIVENWVPNDVSSTDIRRQLRRGLSVKYVLDDNVLSYILENNLYRTVIKNTEP